MRVVRACAPTPPRQASSFVLRQVFAIRGRCRASAGVACRSTRSCSCQPPFLIQLEDSMPSSAALLDWRRLGAPWRASARVLRRSPAVELLQQRAGLHQPEDCRANVVSAWTVTRLETRCSWARPVDVDLLQIGCRCLRSPVERLAMTSSGRGAQDQGACIVCDGIFRAAYWMARRPLALTESHPSQRHRPVAERQNPTVPQPKFSRALAGS